MITALFLATTVLLPDGSPASGARAASLAKEYFVHVQGIAFARPTESAHVAADGTLDVTPETVGRWVILHESGWGNVDISVETDVVRLEPWEELSGVVAAPLADEATVSYHRTERPRRTDERGSVFWTSTAPVEDDGTFTLRHVPRGHGTIGLLREAKRERRVFRWRDYVRVVDVPAPGPANLAGGVTVSGRIVASDLPAVITLASKGPETTCHGLTDDEGRFAIPGVLPGSYRLTARPDRGSTTLDIPQRTIDVGIEPLDLGDLSSVKRSVAIDPRVEMFEGLVERIPTEAAKHSTDPISKVWIGEVTHPTGQYGTRVTFAPRVDPSDPTRATQTTLLIDIPGEPIRKYYPEHDSLGWGFQFEDAPFGKSRSFERSLRVFPLTQRTLHLPLDEGVDYADALALLRAIESDTIQRNRPKIERLPDGSSRMTRYYMGDITGVRLRRE
ncbi:MAG: hypothetical protein Fur0032_22030 [Terrimicrobiaceae bacterium]